MQMDVWGAEVYGIIAAADQALWALEQQLLQLQQQPSSNTISSTASSSNNSSRTEDSSKNGDELEAGETAAALAASMQGALQDAVANVQRLYDKRYQQVEVSDMIMLAAVLEHANICDFGLVGCSSVCDASLSLSALAAKARLLCTTRKGQAALHVH
jgi:hypothetical protein